MTSPSSTPPGPEIETAFFPRLRETEEIVLRIAAEVSSSGMEIVERSSGRIGVGSVYSLVERLHQGGWLAKRGRQYELSEKGRRWLRAVDAAAKIFAEAR